MDDNLIGLVAVTMIFGIPLAAMYTFYHVRKLRTEERLAAIARFYGNLIGVKYGEPFVVKEAIEIGDIVNIPVRSI